MNIRGGKIFKNLKYRDKQSIFGSTILGSSPGIKSFTSFSTPPLWKLKSKLGDVLEWDELKQNHLYIQVFAQESSVDSSLCSGT